MKGTVTLDIEVIQQWFDWLAQEDLDSLRRDFEEVLLHPERCQ